MSYYQSDSEAADKARAKLAGFIDSGREQAGDFFGRLQREMPRDYVVSTGKLDFDYQDNRIVVSTPQNQWFLHRNAFQQLVAKTGILTGNVADKMFDAHNGEPWGRELLLHNLRTMYGKGSRDRVLIRVVQTDEQASQGIPGEIRGFLSDRYRRLNTGPIFQAFAEAAHNIGAVPMRFDR